MLSKFLLEGRVFAYLTPPKGQLSLKEKASETPCSSITAPFTHPLRPLPRQGLGGSCVVPAQSHPPSALFKDQRCSCKHSSDAGRVPPVPRMELHRVYPGTGPAPALPWQLEHPGVCAYFGRQAGPRSSSSLCSRSHSCLTVTPGAEESVPPRPGKRRDVLLAWESFPSFTVIACNNILHVPFHPPADAFPR